MLPVVSVRDGCVWVESDLDYFQIMDALDTLIARHACPIKGLVWVFSPEPIAVKFDEIEKLIAIVRTLFRGIEPNTKIAIVTASAFHTSIVTCFHQVAADLPLHLQTFVDPALALEWATAD
jgi:hypothetical protein